MHLLSIPRPLRDDFNWKTKFKYKNQQRAITPKVWCLNMPVMVLEHNTSPKWDISAYEVSS